MMRGGKVRRQEKELTHPPPRFPKGAPKGRREDKGFFILGGERREASGRSCEEETQEELAGNAASKDPSPYVY